MLLPSIILLTVFCQFQTFQFRKMVIHWDSMTKDKYWGVFMDFDGFLNDSPNPQLNAKSQSANVNMVFAETVFFCIVTRYNNGFILGQGSD